MGLYAQRTRHGLQNPRRSDPAGRFLNGWSADGEQTVRVLTGHSGVSGATVFNFSLRPPMLHWKWAWSTAAAGGGRNENEIWCPRYHTPLLVTLH